MDASARQALFISHANPEDNAFARWVGAKLAAMGYEVWADVLRLSGGKDWSRELEDALRNRAAKMLLVGTPISVGKQGVRNEIQIASDVAKKIADNEFIIPLRLSAYDAPFLVAHAQYIDFSETWAAGFIELVETLQQTYKLSPRKPASLQNWYEAQAYGAMRLVKAKERLISNWLKISSIPSAVHYFEAPSGFPIEKFQDRALHKWPIVPAANGILTFALPDDSGRISADMPAKLVASEKSKSFLEKGWERQAIAVGDARRMFSDLCNQSIENYLNARALTSYEIAGGRRAWWGNIKTVPHTMIGFNWKHNKGRRQIIGQSGKRGVHWHFAVMGQVKTWPVHYLKLSCRLVFSDNGLDAIKDPKKMHKLRRSFAKSWRNARWRDMMLSFLWWLSQGGDELQLPVSDQERLVVTLPPLTFQSPVSVFHNDSEVIDEDDPDVEYDTWGDDLDEDGIVGVAVAEAPK